MGARFTYSRWDGTQRGADLDAAGLFDELADDLLYHGDVDAALRRMLQQGSAGLEGLRDLLRRLREAREQHLARHDLSGVLGEITAELDDIVDEERHAIDQAMRAAERSGDDRRAASAHDAGTERLMHLDLLPDDLAGRIRGLEAHDFESREARARLEQLVERLRSQFAQQAFDRLSSAMQSVTPEDMARTREMLAALNEMIERRARGENPEFEAFMAEYGDMFPEGPNSLDELLEQMARRMAQMQALLNSMSPEQRAELQALSEQVLGDAGLGDELGRLGAALRGMFPDAGWSDRHEFGGDDPLGLDGAMDAMRDLADLDRLEHLLRSATSPAMLAEADLERVAELLGADAAASLEQLARLTEMLESQGLIQQREGRLHLTPKGLRAIGAGALRDLFTRLGADMTGQHEVHRIGVGHERTYETKPYEFGDPFNLDLQRTVRNALRRRGAGTPVRLAPDDFEVERTEHLTRSSTVLMLDLSMSMPMRDNFLPAKKVAIALHALITSQFPRDYLGLIGFSETAYALTAAQLPEVSWDLAYGTNMHHGLTLARRLLTRQTGTKQIIMITDGEPTAHVEADGEVFFNYPPVRATVEATLREVMRCTREGIRINTFMLDANHGLTAFVEQLTRINRGRAFFTDRDTLGDYVLVDFLEHRRQVSRGGRRAG
ncbi:MAG: hypothetical protein ACKOA2_09360 [Ilumatobacteraceae bacterium]